MKHKLTDTERDQRIERRAQARADRATRRQAIRDWFDARRDLAEKRRKKAAEAPVAGDRGVDRVPHRYRTRRRPIEYLVEHHDLSRAERRARGFRAGSGNVPHINPGRDAKSLAAGRLRKELQP